MLQAAMPVDAVTATDSGTLACFRRSSLNDFPSGARIYRYRRAVKNTFLPSSTTICSTLRCSCERKSC